MFKFSTFGLFYKNPVHHYMLKTSLMLSLVMLYLWYTGIIDEGNFSQAKDLTSLVLKNNDISNQNYEDILNECLR